MPPPVLDENAPLLLPAAPARRPRTAVAVAVAVAVTVAAAVVVALFAALRRASSAAAAAAAAAAAPTVTLVALGDWGRDAQHGQGRVASALASFIASARRSSAQVAVVSTGDNFYKAGVSSPHDPKFNSSFEQVYHHAPLRAVPWYLTLGNHDHLGDIHAQLAYSALSPRWNMPLAYFSRRLSPTLLAVFLDTTPFVHGAYGKHARVVNRQSPRAQLVWLRNVLRALDRRTYVIIVGHHNMYSMSIDDHLGTPSVRDALEPVLAPHAARILAYVSGHEHSLMHMQPAVRPHIVDHFLSGAGSKLHRIVEPPPQHRQKWLSCCDVLPVRPRPTAPRTVWGRSTNGFFAFHFDGSTFSAHAIDADCNLIYEYSKTLRTV